MWLSYSESLNEEMLSADEERAAIIAWQDRRDQAALTLLVRSHARLAWKYANANARDEAAREDLAQWGKIGLVRAANKYKRKYKGRFGKYAIWWVRNSIAEGLRSTLCGIAIPDKLFLDSRRGKLAPHEREAIQAALATASLDAPISADDDTTLGETLESPSPSPEAIAEEASMGRFYRSSVLTALEQLTAREQEVLRRRRLLETPDTLEVIANDLGLTRERIRQIEKQAEAKLRRVLIRSKFPVQMLSSA